jgi:hypothetical protein
MKFVVFLLSLALLIFSGFLTLYFFEKNHKIIQKTVEVEINFKNTINVCKSEEDTDFSISF